MHANFPEYAKNLSPFTCQDYQHTCLFGLKDVNPERCWDMEALHCSGECVYPCRIKSFYQYYFLS